MKFRQSSLNLYEFVSIHLLRALFIQWKKKTSFYWRCNAVDNIRPCIDLLDFNKQLWKEERPPLKTPSSFKAGDAHALIDWYHTPLLLSKLININKSKYPTEWPSLQTLFHTKFIAESAVGWNLGELCPKEYF